MTDATTNTGTTPDNKNNGSGTPGASDANTNTGTDANAGNQGTIDTSKWTDAEWEKVYNDPKLYNNPRFKTLNDRANKAKELEEAQRVAEEKKLTEQKEFEKLAKLKETEANDWKSKAQTAFMDNQIAIEAQKAGVVDLEAVTKLLNREGIKISDDGVVTGVAEAVKSLVDAKPYLKGKAPVTNIGSGTNPGTQDTTTPRFKHSQLKDPVFFKAHEKEITQAWKLGLIEAD